MILDTRTFTGEMGYIRLHQVPIDIKPITAKHRVSHTICARRYRARLNREIDPVNYVSMDTEIARAEIP